jgi:hypothetical protein
MSSPRNPGRDLRLERLGDRDDLRRAHLGEAAQLAPSQAGPGSVKDYLAAYQALIDAVFTAPGAAEWLLALRLRVAMMLAEKDAPPQRAPVSSSDAIRVGRPGPGAA